MAVKDYYRLMGVEREASDEEIKKAYRKLALQYHPDRNRGNSDCEEHLKEVNEAYQVLGDEEKRRQYDLMCGQPYGDQMFYGGDLSDELISVLREFFRGGFPIKGLGGCRGGFRKRGCKRRSFFKE